MELTQQIEALTQAVTASQTKMAEEVKNLGATLAETKAANLQLRNELDSYIAKQADYSSKTERKGLAEQLRENEEVARIMKNGKGATKFKLEGKAVSDLIDSRSGLAMIQKNIDSSTIGYSTAGVMPFEMGSYVQEPRKQLRMRDVIPSRGISVGQYSFPKYSVIGTKASPVAERSQKPINIFDPTIVTERVKTIATYFECSRQVLEDYNELQGILESLGSYKVNAEMDRQILSGSNTGEDLDGVITQATAYDTSLLSATTGYTLMDQINAAAQQVAAADEFAATFFVCHPTDWYRMTRLKDSNKNYLLGGPMMGAGPRDIWGLTPVPTTQISSGSFLVGAGISPAIEFRNRMDLEVAISTEEGNNFTKNMVTIRFEARGLLAVYRPGSFITGTFLNSPAQS
jgi:HK97 family phage major capsid protein